MDAPPFAGASWAGAAAAIVLPLDLAPLSHVAVVYSSDQTHCSFEKDARITDIHRGTSRERPA
ncbi:hypothetical protein ACP4OV_016003 [Aristida adscensionis]